MSDTLYSYLSTTANYSQEFYTQDDQMFLVFLITAGASYYMNDAPTVCLTRGCIMALGQYIGGLASAALNQTNFFTNQSLANYGPLAVKLAIVTSFYIGVNRAVFGFDSPDTASLFAESFGASLISHYAAPYIPSISSITGIGPSTSTAAASSSSSSSSLTSSSALPTY